MLSLCQLRPSLSTGQCLQVTSVVRVQKNTCAHTGVMLWEAALPLARFILACRSLFECASDRRRQRKIVRLLAILLALVRCCT